MITTLYKEGIKMHFNDEDVQHPSDETPVEVPIMGADLPQFGDYVEIEQKRFGSKNEFYSYKVIGTLRSNMWVDVPVLAGGVEDPHDEMADVVSCICCGVSEYTVKRFRVCDVKVTSRHSDRPMELGRVKKAQRRALVLFDEWIRTTGVFHEHGSYRYEIEGIIEDAVHCGIQEAMGIYKKLESEQSDEVCPECSGTGEVVHFSYGRLPDPPEKVPCSKCNSTGSWTEEDDQQFTETFGAFDDSRGHISE